MDQLWTKKRSLLESLRFAANGTKATWVDIHSGEFFTLNLETGRVSVQYVGKHLSFAHPLRDGGFLFAAGQKIGVCRDGRVQELSADLIPTDRRFNDGCIDTAGRLVIGTMNLFKNDRHNSLLCFEKDGSVTTLDSEVGLSNGLAVTPKKGDLLSIDSAAGTIVVRPLKSDQSYGHPEILHHFVDETPDGISVSEDGNIVVALWGSGCIARLKSSGETVERWSVPRKFVTSPALHPVTGDLLVAAASDFAATQAIGGKSGGIWKLSVGMRGLASEEWEPFSLSTIKLGV